MKSHIRPQIIGKENGKGSRKVNFYYFSKICYVEEKFENREQLRTIEVELSFSYYAIENFSNH